MHIPYNHETQRCLVCLCVCMCVYVHAKEKDICTCHKIVSRTHTRHALMYIHKKKNSCTHVHTQKNHAPYHTHIMYQLPSLPPHRHTTISTPTSHPYLNPY